MHVPRKTLVAAARDWIGTPYHPCADLKGVGVDCGMLIVRVFVDGGLCAPFDPRPYPPDWHLHRDEERYLGFVTTACRERSAEEQSLPGDIAVFRIGRCWAHGGIVTMAEPLTIVHAFSPAGCVIEEPVSRNGLLASTKRQPRIFSLSAWTIDEPR
jgi:cell wall-associated NlpC family hydrolase